VLVPRHVGLGVEAYELLARLEAQRDERADELQERRRLVAVGEVEVQAAALDRRNVQRELLEAGLGGFGLASAVR